MSRQWYLRPGEDGLDRQGQDPAAGVADDLMMNLGDVMDHGGGMNHRGDGVGHGDVLPSLRVGDGIHHDAAPGDVNCRLARNQSEKARRDRVSAYIGNMQTYLPILNNSAKKVDKITILRIGANQVRMAKIAECLSESLEGDKVDFRHGDVAETLAMEDMKSVCFMVSENGKIVYVTRSVETILGHTQVELLGLDFKKMVHSEDYDVIDAALRPDGGPIHGLDAPLVSSDDSSSEDTGTSASMSSSMSSPSGVSSPPPPQGAPAPPPPPPEYQKRELCFRIQQRPVSRLDKPQYEQVRADGFLLVLDKARPAASSHRRKSHDNSESSPNILCILVRLLRETRSVTLNCLDLPNNEYYTRHTMDGCFLYTDHRISVVSGYLPEEVTGINAFEYMHKDDAKWAQVALKQMFARNEKTGYSCYRLKSKSGEYIYLKTYGYLEKEPSTGAINSFICINRLVSFDEAQEAMKEMQKRFGPQSPQFLKQKSGVTIVEMADDADVGQHETIKSSSEPPPGVLADLVMVSQSLPVNNVPNSPSGFSVASPEACGSGNDFGGPTRASVLHMAGDARRGAGRKRPSESEHRGLKRNCPSSPGASVPRSTPGTPVGAQTPTPVPVPVRTPHPLPLSVDVTSPLPMSHPHSGLRGASPSGLGGFGVGVFPGPSSSVSPGIPDVPGFLDELSLSVLEGPGKDLSYLAQIDDMSVGASEVTMCPNGAWGRSGASDLTGPVPLPHPLPSTVPGLEDPMLSLASAQHSELEDVSADTFYLEEMGVNSLQLQSHLQDPADLILQQRQIGTNLGVQGETMMTLREDLSQVPHNNPERRKIENVLSEVQEEHSRQEKILTELHRETLESR